MDWNQNIALTLEQGEIFGNDRVNARYQAQLRRVVAVARYTYVHVYSICSDDDPPDVVLLKPDSKEYNGSAGEGSKGSSKVDANLDCQRSQLFWRQTEKRTTLTELSVIRVSGRIHMYVPNYRTYER